jgi:hypothetical protein
MDKVTFIEVTEPITGEVVEHALIAHTDGSFTSMPKSEYDKRQAEQSTPKVAAK